MISSFAGVRQLNQFIGISILKKYQKKFILGDERDVSLNSKNSNYNNIKKNLFKNKINKNKFIFFDVEKNKSKKKNSR